MHATNISKLLESRLAAVVDRHDFILSATLTGSFPEQKSLEGISDVDFVVVVDDLNDHRYRRLLADFDAELRPALRTVACDLLINSTLGPLKFNEAGTVVLHLMLYSEQAHVEHVLQSPFTCLDWQRSPNHYKRPLSDVYPVFGLQPRHFMSSRRGPRDYLRDLEDGVVSYRELVCSADGYQEVRRSKPMSPRDRHEFAYHVLRFLMQNLLKLVRRRNFSLPADSLARAFFQVFPHGAEQFAPLYHALADKKRLGDYAQAVAGLDEQVRDFVGCFEWQFRQAFFVDSSRHIMFRHAATALNQGLPAERVFLGRSDVDAKLFATDQIESMRAAIAEVGPSLAFCSPMKRCRQSLNKLTEPAKVPMAFVDDRLREIDYGACEGLNAAAIQRQFPELVENWSRGLDPPFPEGESNGDVLSRISEFAADYWSDSGPNTIACTHNVVLRCLVGHALGVPRKFWYRLQIPHLAPITFLQTRNFGWFVDLDDRTERAIFADFRGNKEKVIECNL